MIYERNEITKEEGCDGCSPDNCMGCEVPKGSGDIVAELRRCPFCGRLPNYYHPKETSAHFIMCENPYCGVQPSVSDQGLDGTISAWNNGAESSWEAGEEVFQSRVIEWILECFGEAIASDKVERNHRFLEEALELMQACGGTKEEALQLVDYVFSRPVGEKEQEVGGVMLTLSSLCSAQGIEMIPAGYRELDRVWKKMDVIRAKQARKPKNSPLPG